ncbi:MAG TPA: hypothetical protein DCX34_15320, partial [Roseovarius sp.]|nr:hypothetical protein [Roseovarius sp.]
MAMHRVERENGAYLFVDLFLDVPQNNRNSDADGHEDMPVGQHWQTPVPFGDALSAARRAGNFVRLGLLPDSAHGAPGHDEHGGRAVAERTGRSQLRRPVGESGG